MIFMRNSTKQPAKPRGRPRAYDPERAIAHATETFWHAGYAATSLDDLSAATGMNRPSLYSAFGDKHALYLAALDRYIEEGHAAIDAALADDLPLPQALERMYDRALAMYYPPDGDARGCFLIGTAVTEARADHVVRDKLHAGLQRFDRAIEARLQRSKARGELAEQADPATLARLASSIVYTLALRSRAGDARAALRTLAASAIPLICGQPAVGGTPAGRGAKRRTGS